MHAYSDGAIWKPYADVGLIAATIAIEAATSHFLPRLAALGPASLVIRAVVFIAILAVLTLVFTHWIWRLLWKQPWAGMCNFSGHYRICVENGCNFISPANLIIDQNWRRIGITFELGDYVYKSLSAAIVFNRLLKGQIELVCTYYAITAHPGADPSINTYGTIILKRLARGDTLEVTQFTDRNVQPFGDKKISVMRNAG